jgi:uncharacterized protein (DUF4213/DUF364 family)
VNYFTEEASNKRIESVTAGLKYTAVTVEGGGMGVAYTWTDTVAGTPAADPAGNENGATDQARNTRPAGTAGACCPKAGTIYENFEGRPAQDLLERLTGEEPLHISMALALVNALNAEKAARFDEDRGKNPALFEALGAGRGSRVAMVGYFRPIEKLLTDMGADVYIHDRAHGIGSGEELSDRLTRWADSLILTSTTIIGGAFDEILGRCPENLPAALLGPSTPMVPELFSGGSIRYIGGTVPEDTEAALRVIRQGGGTRDFQKYGKKVYALPGVGEVTGRIN